ncbi:MAG: hypothetical protein FJ295_07985 [Planctomycetes bacterium]|nr:hypothetical protein [Planctomycetota bacterium]
MRPTVGCAEGADHDSLRRVGSPGNSGRSADLHLYTAGIHLQLAPLSNLRIGAVVPLRAAPERVFDSELQVSFNRLF